MVDKSMYFETEKVMEEMGMSMMWSNVGQTIREMIVEYYREGELNDKVLERIQKDIEVLR